MDEKQPFILNDLKREVMILGNDTQVNKVLIDQRIAFGMDRVSPTATVKNIGAVLDNRLDMSHHVVNVCQSCYIHIRTPGKIRPFLSVDTALKLVHDLISSKLDYRNALLYGISD